MNKKILIIAYNFSPMNNAGVQRVKNFVKYLPQYGYDVDIITVGDSNTIDRFDNYQIFRFFDKFERIVNSKNKFLNFFSKLFFGIGRVFGIVIDYNFCWKNNVLKNVNQILENNKYDFVMPSFPPISDLEIGIEISKKYDIPLIVDYRDGLLFEPFKWVTNKGPLYYNQCKSIESDVAKLSSLQMAVTPYHVDYLNKTYYGTNNILLENGFDDEEKIVDSNINLPRGFNIVFTGRIRIGGEIYNKKILFNTLTYLFKNNKDVNFNFFGEFNKNEKYFFKKFANVYVYEKISHDESLALQKESDALLLLTNNNFNSTHGKLYEYIFAHKPIINIGGDTNAKRIIKETNSGETFSYDQIQLVNEYINKIKNGFNYKQNNIDKYSRRKQNMYLANQLDKLFK